MRGPTSDPTPGVVVGPRSRKTIIMKEYA